LRFEAMWEWLREVVVCGPRPQRSHFFDIWGAEAGERGERGARGVYVLNTFRTSDTSCSSSFLGIIFSMLEI
jgi:hypothetical protein